MQQYNVYYDDLMLNKELNSFIKYTYCEISNFNEHKNSQCWLHKFYNDEWNIKVLILQSYNTIVCAYIPVLDKIYCNSTYSPTTRKHIGYFADEINKRFNKNYTYYDFKKVAGE